ncbi:MAG: response regulator, partial [Bacteroides sp.]
NGGDILLRITETEENILFEVIDTGIGIDKKDLDCIFEQFYQVKHDNDTDTSSGIGLALTKSIVLMHHGELNVESQPGKGSRFAVQLQKGKSIFEHDKEVSFVESDPEEEGFIKDSIPDNAFITNLQAEQGELDAEEQEHKRYTILIVEDNRELIQLLANIFDPLYKVILAYNGEEGLTKATAEKPDIILSDVMMPVMNGIDLCLQIKNNINLCHIPVVLLTALNTVDQNIAGLRRGADDYISKPFNAKILLTRCNNLIRNRKLIQNQFTKSHDTNVDLLTTNPLDKVFLERAISAINEHIDNTELNIPLLCQALGVGHTLLHAKFKGLTGMAPNEFILNYRLKQAASVLRKEPHLQVSEVSDRFGFSSARYFSRCFKNQFNITPMEYRKGETNDNPKEG